MFRIFAGRKER